MALEEQIAEARKRIEDTIQAGNELRHQAEQAEAQRKAIDARLERVKGATAAKRLELENLSRNADSLFREYKRQYELQEGTKQALAALRDQQMRNVQELDRLQLVQKAPRPPLPQPR